MPDARSLLGLLVRPLLLVLAVESAAVAAVVAGVLTGAAPTRTDALLCGLLMLVAAVHTELSVNAERLRRRIAETRYINMTSVWTFAAALLLPPVLATAVVAVIYVHLYLRVVRPSGTPPHRQVYSAATVLLAVHTVAGLLALVGGWGGAPATPQNAALVLGALIAYTTVNTLLVVSVLRLTAPGSRFLAILWGGDIGLELATLSIGGLVAVVLANTSPGSRCSRCCRCSSSNRRPWCVSSRHRSTPTPRPGSSTRRRGAGAAARCWSATRAPTAPARC